MTYYEKESLTVMVKKRSAEEQDTWVGEPSVCPRDSSLSSAKEGAVSKIRELLDAILYDTIWVEGDFSRDICKHCGVDRPLNPLALSGASGHREDCIYRLALDAEEETL